MARTTREESSDTHETGEQSDSNEMERRLFIGAATGAVGAVALAGCTGGDEGETDESGVDEGERPVELLGIVVYADPKEEEKYEEVVGA